MPVSFLGLGSNTGGRLKNLRKAVILLNKEEGIKSLKISRVYETEPVGRLRQNKFLNAVIKIRTTLKPIELLEVCKSIEKKLKRKKIVKSGPRSIDLDILFFGSDVIKTKRLTVPHRELHKRGFVLVPLNEIAPYAIHPVFKKNIKELLKELKSKKQVKIWRNLNT